MKRQISKPVVLSLLTVALLPMVFAEKTNARQNAQETPFPEAELFFELNDTDGDLGIHASIDGGPWTSLAVEGPNERLLLDVISRGRLRNQGMTQLFFESAEPPFDELDPEVFFRRFPEGVYEIEGRAQGGGTLESTVVLSHVLAARPENILLSGTPAAENCDADPLPVVQSPVLIRWDPVTESHPTIGKPGAIEIQRYQLFVEREDVKLSLDLPPSVTEFEVPAGVTDEPGVYKFEIIARAANGNNTAVESCFQVN
jgi:hypothetical protein